MLLLEGKEDYHRWNRVPEKNLPATATKVLRRSPPGRCRIAFGRCNEELRHSPTDGINKFAGRGGGREPSRRAAPRAATPCLLEVTQKASSSSSENEFLHLVPGVAGKSRRREPVTRPSVLGNHFPVPLILIRPRYSSFFFVCISVRAVPAWILSWGRGGGGRETLLESGRDWV